MEMQLGLLADAAHADQSGKLYILGEFRYIHALRVPAMHQKMVLVVRLVAPVVEVRGSTAQLRLEFTDADGQKVMPSPPVMSIRFAPIGPADRGMVRSQVMVEMGNVPLPHFGDYSIHVWVDGKRVGDVRYHVMKVEAPPGGAGELPAGAGPEQ